MEYKLVKTEGDIIYYEISGNYTRDAGEKILEDLYTHCNKNNCKKIVVDITKKSGQIPVFDRFVLGKLVAKLFSYKIKMAVIGKKDQITNFSSIVASNRGGRLCIFYNTEDAVNWLNEK